MSEPIKVNASGGQAFVNSEFKAGQMHFEENNHYHTISKSNFSKIKFDQEDDLPHPIFMREIQTLLMEQRVLIIASYGIFDQTYFGRQLIKNLCKRNEDIQPSELIQNEENTGLIKQIEAEESGQAILLNEIHPTHLSYDFQRFIDLAVKCNSYYIITTELPRDVWVKCSGFKSTYFFEVSEDNHYRHEELEGWFLKELEKRLPPYLQEEGIIHPAINISETLTVDDLLKALPNPLRLKSLLDYLGNKNELPGDSYLIKEVQHLKSSDVEYITRWFNNLSHNQKILAMTAAVCDGIFHDQYFEVVQQLCQDEFWKASCPELSSIDFHQLVFLPKRADETRFREGILLMSYYNSFRSVVVGLSINEYPRHLETLFREITEVVKTTYSPDKFENWKLYGTSLKIGVIRHVFIEASKDVNIHSFSFIENIYLELASDQNARIQDLAARSIARLRELNKDDFLFATIENWLNNHEIMMQVYLYMKVNQLGDDTTRNPMSCLKATIIRVLAYASSYDQQNQLHSEIYKYLFDFAKAKDGYILNTLASMLPKFIHHNIGKLKKNLGKIMSNPRLNSSASKGLALSYADYPEETKAILEEWFSQTTREINEQERRKSVTPEETKLIALIKTLQKIELDSPLNVIGYSLQELYEKVEILLKPYTKPAIKKEVVELIATIQLQDLDQGVKHSTATLSHLNRKEQRLIADKWTKVYVKQRAKLDIGNADFILEMNRREFPIWLDKSERPLTEIEQKMMSWLDSGNGTAQKMATLTFLTFAKEFDQHEESIIQRHHKEEEEKERLRKADLDHGQTDTVPKEVQVNRVGFWLRVKIFLYSIFATSEQRRALKEVTNLLINTGGYSSEELKLVIEKWKLRGEDNGLATKLAKWLERLF